MEQFYGFDLGDAESAVSVLRADQAGKPSVIEVKGAGSFVTAYALQGANKILIGEQACYAPDVSVRRIGFKSRFLTDSQASTDLQRFAKGVLQELSETTDLAEQEDIYFYVGCPAGWDLNDREVYRELFEKAGYPPVKIISESRAALVSACQSRHLQVGHDILEKPVLVVDIGSSTTDFAYIRSGREVEMKTAGEVFLGGGLMDETILSLAVSRSPQAQQIREVFETSESWRSYALFAARRLKEKYFSDPDYWQGRDCTEPVMIRYQKPQPLILCINKEIEEKLLYGPVDALDGRSFYDVFRASLENVRMQTGNERPDLIFLTGGVSRMKVIRDWCIEIFPESVVITSSEPEFAVSRGLAWSGRIDSELRAFRRDVASLIESDEIENIVSAHIDDLYKETVSALVRPLIEQVVQPVFEDWRSGVIERLAQTDQAMREGVERFLRSEDAKALLAKPVSEWLKPVSEQIEELTVPVCVSHRVPYRALSLRSYFKTSDIELEMPVKDVFAVSEITWLIDSIISVLVGLLCGGSGIALISSGLSGIAAGAVLSIVLLSLGKEKMEDAILQTKIPVPARKIVPRNAILSRSDHISRKIRDDLYAKLEKEKNEEITRRLADDISSQIETCLTKMAEVVEIPLG